MDTCTELQLGCQLKESSRVLLRELFTLYKVTEMSDRRQVDSSRGRVSVIN